MKFAKGVAAGLAGAAAMHAFRIAWERSVPDRTRDGIFGFDHEADVASARLISSLILRQPLSTERSARLGLGLHYVYGALLGAGYGAARERVRWISNAWGVPAGVALWLAADELPISLSGISDPLEKSRLSHISALAAHALYAAVMEMALRCRSVVLR